MPCLLETMNPAEYFYAANPATPACCSCAHWVATRIFNGESFLCPTDGLGACNATPSRSLTSPKSTCQRWRPWRAKQAAQAAR